MIKFEWDERKNLINIKKHGISFKEAISVFYDEYGKVIPDPKHSAEEDRFIIIGLSSFAHILVVCHCYRDEEDDEIIRIISARKATKNETAQYLEEK